ncbi:hypothetical protein TRVL_04506 [Trypanosoma vivax]|nr:hypothetical protein TRVL_04506 [Trypanosoma vivax]
MRRAVFGVFSGYTITDFCMNTLCLPVEDRRSHQQSVHAPSFLDRIFAEPVTQFHQVSTLRGDIEDLLLGSPFWGSMLMMVVVSFGGVWAIAGAAAAVALDGDEGAERYAAVKEWLSN